MFVCLFERQTELERLQETLRLAAEKGMKSAVVSVPVCVSLHTCTFKSVVFVCVCACDFVYSLKCPAGRGEIAGALKMVTEQ